MSKKAPSMSHNPTETCSTVSREVSRREFLKIAGVAGATVGLGAGLGGLLAACGGGTTTTTAATTATTTATTAGSSTTASTQAVVTTAAAAGTETGRELKVGYVTPKTGGLAAFGIADGWCLQKWTEFAAKGVVCGDGKNHPVTFHYEDTQSDSNRAAQLGGDLIQNTKIDVMLVASSPDTVNPVADQCEAMATPCLATDCPREAWVFGRKEDVNVGFKWTYLLAFGMYELITNSVELWGSIPTNKKIACVWPNDTDGNMYRSTYAPLMPQHGYTVVDGGAFQAGTEDYTAMIGKFKQAGCEIVQAMMVPADFTTFWKQCKQQSWVPKIAEVAKASLFPSSMEAIGPIADGVAGVGWWHPTYPYKSSLDGTSIFDLCLDWQKQTGQQWQQPQEHYVLFEWLVDALKRTNNVDDKEALIKAVSTSKMDASVVGPFDFNQPVKPDSPYSAAGVAPIPLFNGQWRTNQGQNPWDDKAYMYNLVITGDATCPQIPVQGKWAPVAGS